jgi:phage regulator Rha-like protein
MAKSARIRARASRTELLTVSRVERSILLIRGVKILLDSDLAEMYGVTTKRLNEQVRRNRSRFPSDFMFQLSENESRALRSQNATLNALGSGRGQHRKYRPYAFTEHGTVMLASVLNSPRAVQASIYVVRAFVRLRQFAATHEAVREKLDELEKRLEQHDEQFAAVFDAIRQLMEPDVDADAEDPNRPRIGYQTELAPPPASQAPLKRRRTPKAARQAVRA